jgi:hypothetical protein
MANHLWQSTLFPIAQRIFSQKALIAPPRMATGASIIPLTLALTLGLGVAAIAAFGWCDHRARERGLIDRTTNY